MRNLLDGAAPTPVIESLADQPGRLVSSVHYDGGSTEVGGWRIKAEAVVRSVVGVPTGEKAFGVHLSFTHAEGSPDDTVACWLDFDECRNLRKMFLEIEAWADDLAHETFDRAEFSHNIQGRLKFGARLKWPVAPRSLALVVQERGLDLPWEALGHLQQLLKQSVSYLEKKGAGQETLAVAK